MSDGGVFAIVQHATGPRRSPKLEEIDADAIAVGPNDVRRIDARFPGVIGNEPAERILGEPRDPAGRVSQFGKGNSGVQFGSAHEKVQTAAPVPGGEIVADSTAPLLHQRSLHRRTYKRLTSGGIA